MPTILDPHDKLVDKRIRAAGSLCYCYNYILTYIYVRLDTLICHYVVYIKLKLVIYFHFYSKFSFFQNYLFSISYEHQIAGGACQRFQRLNS